MTEILRMDILKSVYEKKLLHIVINILEVVSAMES